MNNGGPAAKRAADGSSVGYGTQGRSMRGHPPLYGRGRGGQRGQKGSREYKEFNVEEMGGTRQATRRTDTVTGGTQQLTTDGTGGAQQLTMDGTGGAQQLTTDGAGGAQQLTTDSMRGGGRGTVRTRERSDRSGGWRQENVNNYSSGGSNSGRSRSRNNDRRGTDSVRMYEERDRDAKRGYGEDQRRHDGNGGGGRNGREGNRDNYGREGNMNDGSGGGGGNGRDGNRGYDRREGNMNERSGGRYGNGREDSRNQYGHESMRSAQSNYGSTVEYNRGDYRSEGRDQGREGVLYSNKRSASVMDMGSEAGQKWAEGEQERTQRVDRSMDSCDTMEGKEQKERSDRQEVHYSRINIARTTEGGQQQERYMTDCKAMKEWQNINSTGYNGDSYNDLCASTAGLLVDSTSAALSLGRSAVWEGRVFEKSQTTGKAANYQAMMTLNPELGQASGGTLMPKEAWYIERLQPRSEAETKDGYRAYMKGMAKQTRNESVVVKSLHIDNAVEKQIGFSAVGAKKEELRGPVDHGVAVADTMLKHYNTQQNPIMPVLINKETVDVLLKNLCSRDLFNTYDNAQYQEITDGMVRAVMSSQVQRQRAVQEFAKKYDHKEQSFSDHLAYLGMVETLKRNPCGGFKEATSSGSTKGVLALNDVLQDVISKLGSSGILSVTEFPMLGTTMAANPLNGMAVTREFMKQGKNAMTERELGVLSTTGQFVGTKIEGKEAEVYVQLDRGRWTEKEEMATWNACPEADVITNYQHSNAFKSERGAMTVDLVGAEALRMGQLFVRSNTSTGEVCKPMPNSLLRRVMSMMEYKGELYVDRAPVVIFAAYMLALEDVKQGVMNDEVRFLGTMFTPPVWLENTVSVRNEGCERLRDSADRIMEWSVLQVLYKEEVTRMTFRALCVWIVNKCAMAADRCTMVTYSRAQAVVKQLLLCKTDEARNELVRAAVLFEGKDSRPMSYNSFVNGVNIRTGNGEAYLVSKEYATTKSLYAAAREPMVRIVPVVAAAVNEEEEVEQRCERIQDTKFNKGDSGDIKGAVYDLHRNEDRIYKEIHGLHGTQQASLVHELFNHDEEDTVEEWRMLGVIMETFKAREINEKAVRTVMDRYGNTGTIVEYMRGKELFLAAKSFREPMGEAVPTLKRLKNWANNATYLDKATEETKRYAEGEMFVMQLLLAVCPNVTWRKEEGRPTLEGQLSVMGSLWALTCKEVNDDLKMVAVACWGVYVAACALHAAHNQDKGQMTGINWDPRMGLLTVETPLMGHTPNVVKWPAYVVNVGTMEAQLIAARVAQNHPVRCALVQEEDQPDRTTARMVGTVWMTLMNAFNVNIKYRSRTMAARLLRSCWDIRRHAVAVVGDNESYNRSSDLIESIATLMNDYRVIGEHAQGEMLMGVLMKHGNGVSNSKAALEIILLVLEGKFQWSMPAPWAFIQEVGVDKFERPQNGGGGRLIGGATDNEGKAWRETFATRMKFKGELTKVTCEFVDKVVKELGERPISCAMVVNKLVDALKQLGGAQTQDQLHDEIWDVVTDYQQNQNELVGEYLDRLQGKMIRCEKHTVDKQTGDLQLWQENRLAMIAAPISPIVAMVAMMAPWDEAEYSVLKLIQKYDRSNDITNYPQEIYDALSVNTTHGARLTTGQSQIGNEWPDYGKFAYLEEISMYLMGDTDKHKMQVRMLCEALSKKHDDADRRNADQGGGDKDDMNDGNEKTGKENGTEGDGTDPGNDDGGQPEGGMDSLKTVAGEQTTTGTQHEEGANKEPVVESAMDVDKNATVTQPENGADKEPVGELAMDVDKATTVTQPENGADKSPAEEPTMDVDEETAQHGDGADKVPGDETETDTDTVNGDTTVLEIDKASGKQGADNTVGEVFEDTVTGSAVVDGAARDEFGIETEQGGPTKATTEVISGVLDESFDVAPVVGDDGYTQESGDSQLMDDISVQSSQAGTIEEQREQRRVAAKQLTKVIVQSNRRQTRSNSRGAPEQDPAQHGADSTEW